MTALVQRGVLPTLEAPDDTGKAVIVNPAGDNYVLGAAQSGASVAATLHYRVSGQTKATAPASGVWVPDLAGVNGEPTGSLSQEEWDPNWDWAQAEVPVSAALDAGFYNVIWTTDFLSPFGGPPGGVSLTLLPVTSGTVTANKLDMDFSLTQIVRDSILVPVDKLYSVEIDFSDGVNVEPYIDLWFVKVADAPLA